jgi:hypothetical protein
VNDDARSVVYVEEFMRRSTIPPSLATAIVVASCGAPAREPAHGDEEPPIEVAGGPRIPLAPITPSQLCTESGRVEVRDGNTLHVDSGGMRGVVAGDRSDVAEVSFTYRGPSRETTPLASGELRRQLGLKLRAKDTCNVVYVTWHVEPTPGIFVSVKFNPTASTHTECGAGGYINITPKTAAPVPIVRPNEPHTLRAEIDGSTLRVTADGTIVWTGTLPPEAASFVGPAGVRSDNGAYDFELRVPGGGRRGVGCSVTPPS